jgi:putative transposase
MRDTYTVLHIHLTWSTWDHAPLISPQREAAIYACIKKECLEKKVFVKAIGGTPDHVHLLVDIPPALCVADLAKQVKAVSSLLVNTHLGPRGSFKWQGAYGAFAVSRWDVEMVAEYIHDQKQHHARKSTIADLEWEP